MKTWESHERHLLDGEWHIHTSYTDGTCTVAEVASAARRLGIPLIAFTEHVRKSVDYDFGRFIEDVERARDDYPDMVVLSGVEAKLLADGTVDADAACLKMVDYPVFAIHGFPADRELLLDCLLAALRDDRLNAWAHPYSFFRGGSVRLDDADLGLVFETMADRRVLFELNDKYGMPPAGWLESARKAGVRFVRGSDVHRLEQVRAY